MSVPSECASECDRPDGGPPPPQLPPPTIVAAATRRPAVFIEIWRRRTNLIDWAWVELVLASVATIITSTLSRFDRLGNTISSELCSSSCHTSEYVYLATICHCNCLDFFIYEHFKDVVTALEINTE